MFRNVFFVVFGVLLLYSILTIYRVSLISSSLRKLNQYPNEQEAEKLLERLRSVRGMTLFVWKYGQNSRVPYERLRAVFNNRILHGPIDVNVKLGIRNEMERIGTYGLLQVGGTGRTWQQPAPRSTPKPAPRSTPKPEQTPEEAKAAAEAFGVGGEENVWHNLKALAELGRHDVYRDVRIPAGDQVSQIDAVVVGESCGVMLLEVKSLGGDREADGTKTVSYKNLDADPSNQLLRHRFALMGALSQLQDDQVTDVLVLSYPNGQERRVVDYASFPQSRYDVVGVEQLLEYLVGKPHGALSGSDRTAIAETLKPYSRESKVSCK